MDIVEYFYLKSQIKSTEDIAKKRRKIKKEFFNLKKQEKITKLEIDFIKEYMHHKDKELKCLINDEVYENERWDEIKNRFIYDWELENNIKYLKKIKKREKNMLKKKVIESIDEKNSGVRPTLVNFDAYYHMLKHKIMITNVKPVKIVKKRILENEGGLFSTEMGSLIDTEEETREYCCECGNLKGRFYEGQLCPQCDTTVKDKFYSDILKFGWIDIYPYYVISPVCYLIIQKVIGENALERILDSDSPLDINGIPIKKEVNKNKPYDGIGMVEFRRKFEQILLYYANKSKDLDKIKNAKLLISKKNRVFCSKIPVVNSLLRPNFLSNGRTSSRLDPINKPYMSIVRNADIIKRSVNKISKISILNNLWSIQKNLNELETIIIDKFTDKKKLVRGKIISARMNFSSRAVIAPLLDDDKFGIDNIVISYKTFLELYTLEIINMLMRGYGDIKFSTMTPFEIINYINLAKYSDVVDECLLDLMHKLINRKDGLWCLLNRNPTLDLGSIQCMRIVDVIPNAKIKVMLIPLSCLTSMNGDHDGDILNLFNLKEKIVTEAFKKGFRPSQLLLDRTGGDLFNSAFNIFKDIATGVTVFTTPQEKIRIKEKVYGQ